MTKKIAIILICILFINWKPEKISAIQVTESEYFTDSIYSKHLGEYRKHNVYLPKDFKEDKKYPIIYATDGSDNIENSFIRNTLDSLIDSEIIKSVIYVASHSNSKIADSTSQKTGDGKKVYLQYRNFEYTSYLYSEGVHEAKLAKRFENHMKYFKNELIPSIENEYKQDLSKDDRYFYGVSNGAGFGMSLLNKHPNTIGTYLCLSTFGGFISSYTWKKETDYPNLYLEYGSEEPSFLKKEASFLKSKYKELNLFAEINEYQGGHDYKKWQGRFTDIISRILATE